MVLLDGLYATGPVMEICRKNKWQFMIVLQDKSLPSVWEEFHGLKQLEKNNCFAMKWGDRRQRFEWINHIEYCYGPNQRKRLVVHVVVCQETSDLLISGDPGRAGKSPENARGGNDRENIGYAEGMVWLTNGGILK